MKMIVWTIGDQNQTDDYGLRFNSLSDAIDGMVNMLNDSKKPSDMFEDFAWFNPVRIDLFGDVIEEFDGIKITFEKEVTAYAKDNRDTGMIYDEVEWSVSRLPDEAKLVLFLEKWAAWMDTLETGL